ncbi:tRNA 2-selenouridine(34) synthase MnmH [Desulfotomaculum copahuensis]|uniref:tRNA 2-selenouridine(34) synthase MnmH n=1 Tax=Desulfotomaculum copahuensis TaxID=1838280 RepID=A0A1B7LJF8_9FIRM|nr:tRNA 2-selenouridine(34) synthase MnmH [Desulfotomaculum copahuensis]OAT86686.1 tRNA 2-selenouridine(34) synthase MnmH [Desulfotomaculum copahuensis]
MQRNITVPEALDLTGAVLVDVRSEAEFAEATIPGAVNIPLLDNVQRALVGVAYKERGPQYARRLGLDLTAPRLPRFIASFDRLAAGRPVVLFCWRGGLRSQYSAGLLEVMGFPVYRILGGYKAYRRYVNEYLGRESLPLRAVVLHGLTGVGKTRLLTALAQTGVPVLDLEGLAAHRGSVFGKIGMPPSPSQKMFEGLIVQALRQAQTRGLFVVECESRRLGRLLVPPVVFKSIQEGYRVLLYDSLENRVRRIREDYIRGPDGNVDALQKAVAALEKYLGRQRVAELNRELAGGDFNRVFSDLLTGYYDPLYKYPAGPSDDYHLSVDMSDLPGAVDKVRRFVLSLPGHDHLEGGEGCGNRQYAQGGAPGSRYFAGGCRRGYQDPGQIPGSVGKGSF